MRPLEHRNSGVVGDGFPEGSVTASVTGDGTPIPFAPSASDLDRGDVLAGRFQIEALIGTGGSGRVLRAFDRESRMLVALKILRQELAGEAVWAERFARELRVGRAISHPNVCRVFDIGEGDGHRFLSMELATGGSLRADVPKVDAWQAARRDRPARAWDDKVSDARAIVAGVAALHQEGIVHRDLKPENILRMQDGRLVVTDFGLATDPGSGPGTTIMVGTPSYMAPEVVMGEPATLRSDVWGLGVVLHEIFFGLRPQWKVIARGYRRFVRPEAARTPVELAVADLCGRCADDDPQSRPETASDVERELERALRGRRVIAPYMRRRLLWGTTAMAAMVALVVVKTYFTNQAKASSSQAAADAAGQLIHPHGTPEEWSRGSRTLAAFAGRVHCFQSIHDDQLVRVVWDQPPRAEDIDVRTGARTPSPIRPETYRDGCPVVSPDGQSILFERGSDTGTHIFLSNSKDGADAKQVVRGSDPTWLPNGQEFAFAADASHSAMFSIPTGEMSFASEPNSVAGRKMFSGQAVNADGTRLAVRYTIDGPASMIVIYSLPSLKVLRQERTPFSNGAIRFEGDQIQYVYEGTNGRLEIASLNWIGGSATTLAGFAADDLKGVVNRTEHGLAFFTSRLSTDLWLKRAGELNRLTSDGESMNGSSSKNGDFVFQRRMADGRRSIFLRRSSGSTVRVSAGPFDITPTFLPDGREWLYVAFDRATIYRCALSGTSCVPLHTDDLVPAFPTTDPSGQYVAYVTLMKAARLRVFALARPDEQRDLGPASASCAPIWTDHQRIWVVQSSSEAGLKWAEVDVRTGRPSGRESTSPANAREECSVPAEVLSSRSSSNTTQVVTISDVSSALALRP